MSPQANKTGRVFGVVSSEHGEAVLDAIVTIKGTGLSIRVHPGGRFQLDGVPEGRHCLECSAPKYEKFTTQTNVEADKTTKVACDLKRLIRMPLTEPVVLLPMRLEIRRQQKATTPVNVGRLRLEEASHRVLATGITHREFSHTAEIAPTMFKSSEYWIRWYPDELQNYNFLGRFTETERAAWIAFEVIYEKEIAASGPLDDLAVELDVSQEQLEIYFGVRPGYLSEDTRNTAALYDEQTKELIASTGAGIRKALGWRDLVNEKIKQAWIELSEELGPIRSLQIARHMTTGSWEFDTDLTFQVGEHHSDQLDQGVLSEELRSELLTCLPDSVGELHRVTIVTAGSEWTIATADVTRPLVLRLAGGVIVVTGAGYNVHEPLDLLIDQGAPLPTLPKKVSLYTIRNSRATALVTDIEVNRDALRLSPTELEGSHWMTDFNQAIDDGMGVKVTDAKLVQNIDDADWLVIVGVDSVEHSREVFEEAIRRSSALGELSIVPQDAATNNTEEGRSPYTELETDIERYLHATRMQIDHESGQSGTVDNNAVIDTELTRRLFGFHPSTLSQIPGGELAGDREARAMAQVLWSSCTQVTREAWQIPAGLAEQMRRFFVENVRARGPLPVIRVGENPYGILPVVPVKDFVPPPKLEAAWQRLALYKVFFTAIAQNITTLDRATDKFDALMEILRSNAVSNRVDVRIVENLKTRRFAKTRKRVACRLVRETPSEQSEQDGGEPSDTSYLREFAGLESFDPSLFPIDKTSPILKRLLHYTLVAHKRNKLVDGPAELDRIKNALQVLINVPTERLEVLLTEGFDLFSHRLDAWMTAMATARLKECPCYGQKRPPQGIYGWLEKPGQLSSATPRPEFIQAPSVQQAVTAAILRSAAETSESEANESFQVNLSSNRVRSATRFIEGIRHGRLPEELLGAALERMIRNGVDGNVSVEDIYHLRRTHPLRLQTSTVSSEQTTETHTIVDGVRFLEQNKDDKYKALRARLNSIRDAAADLALFEAVDQAVRGNYARVAAWLDFLDGQASPPEIQSIRTQRTGELHGTNIFLPLLSSGEYEMPEHDFRPRCVADPILATWCDELFPDFAQQQIVVRVSRTDGPARREILLSPEQIDMQPIDLVMGGIEELTHKVRYRVLKDWQKSPPNAPNSNFAVLGSFPDFAQSDDLLNEVGIEIDLDASDTDPCNICPSIEKATQLRRLIHQRQAKDTPIVVTPAEVPLIADQARHLDPVETLEVLSERVAKIAQNLSNLCVTFAEQTRHLKLRSGQHQLLPLASSQITKLGNLVEVGDSTDETIQALRITFSRMLSFGIQDGQITESLHGFIGILDSLATVIPDDKQAAAELVSALSESLAVLESYLQQGIVDAAKSSIDDSREGRSAISRYGIDKALAVLPGEPKPDEVSKVVATFDSVVSGLITKFINLRQAYPHLCDLKSILGAMYLNPGKAHASLESVASSDQGVSSLPQTLGISEHQALLLTEFHEKQNCNFDLLFSEVIAALATDTWTPSSLQDVVIAVRTLVSRPNEVATTIMNAPEDGALEAVLSATTLNQNQAQAILEIVQDNQPFDADAVDDYILEPVNTAILDATRLLQAATDGAAMVILTPYYLSNEGPDAHAWELSTDQLREHPVSYLAPYQQVRSAVDNVLSLFQASASARLYEDRRFLATEADSEVSSGTEDFIYLLPDEKRSAPCLSCLPLDEFREGYPNLEETTGITLKFDSPKSEAPHAILVAVPPELNDRKEWNCDRLADALVETIDLFQIRMLGSDDVVQGNLGQVLPTLVFGTDANGEALFPSIDFWQSTTVFGSQFEYVMSAERDSPERKPPSGSAMRSPRGFENE